MHLSAGYNEAVRVLEAAQGDFLVGLVCPEAGSVRRDDAALSSIFAAILGLLDHAAHETHLPRMRLAACTGQVPAAHEQELTKRRILRFTDPAAMMAAHPDINLVVNLSGDSETVRSLRRILPPSVALLDRACAVFLCCLLVMNEVSGKCQTDLRGSRTLLNTIVDELPDDIFFLDDQGRILDVNRQVCERHGVDKQALLHQSSSTVPAGPGQVACGPTRRDWPVLTTLAHRREQETLQTWMDEQGRVHYYQVTAYPVFDETGRVHRMIEVRRDVTLRTEMEKRLQQAEKLAAIGELSTYIAHEIRNPLFAIGGFANSLLRSQELTENSREKVRIILEESKRLDKILKNIINFARPTSSELAEVDANQVVAETVQVLGIGSQERGVILDVRLGEEVPRIRADAELLKQCLINLIKNALEAMPDGGRLTVTTAMERRQVLISIEDTGHGIPVEIQDKIFNPFFTTKQTGSGAGLGLAMTKKIISDLGGDLRLSSRPGKGTQVDLLLQPYVDMETPVAGHFDQEPRQETWNR
ncbi:two-component system sensor histidine kinase NtrB [Desulfonatronum lacustre]|uniref:two-component system sensor histidine kinase NtrB n=1 Tax=Desulfonatronum lacustre TaxID=66849 RepID=UPI000688F511|nr:ATP-binding protein [Desulfonatronum lacustre]